MSQHNNDSNAKKTESVLLKLECILFSVEESLSYECMMDCVQMIKDQSCSLIKYTDEFDEIQKALKTAIKYRSGISKSFMKEHQKHQLDLMNEKLKTKLKSIMQRLSHKNNPKFLAMAIAIRDESIKEDLKLLKKITENRFLYSLKPRQLEVCIEALRDDLEPVIGCKREFERILQVIGKAKEDEKQIQRQNNEDMRELEYAIMISKAESELQALVGVIINQSKVYF